MEADINKKRIDYRELLGDSTELCRYIKEHNGLYLSDGKNIEMVMDSCIYLETREIWKNTKKIVLTDLEFRLLLFLAKSPGRVFSYQQIMELKICPASGKDFHFNLCYPVIGICFCGIHLPDSCRSDWLYKKHDGSLQE